MNWIPITERLPEDSRAVLVYRISDNKGYYPGYYIAFYTAGGVKPHFAIKEKEHDMSSYRPVEEFSHWMPIPPFNLSK